MPFLPGGTVFRLNHTVAYCLTYLLPAGTVCRLNHTVPYSLTRLSHEVPRTLTPPEEVGRLPVVLKSLLRLENLVNHVTVRIVSLTEHIKPEVPGLADCSEVIITYGLEELIPPARDYFEMNCRNYHDFRFFLNTPRTVTGCPECTLHTGDPVISCYALQDTKERSRF